jgi:putative membrane-bound dehydrogenase-like protein
MKLKGRSRHPIGAASFICGLAISGVLALGCGFCSAADGGLEGYKIAPGFHAEVAVSEPMIINPVSMTWGPDGKLYVSEWFEGRDPNDRIKVLSDTNGDGKFDEVKIYIDHLDLPAGIAFWDGWTYVTLEHDVIRMKDKDGDGKFETRETIATGFGNDNSHHRVSGLIIGPDGWLYMTTGDSDAHARGSDDTEATVLRCGGVFRCKPDGSRLENVAFGMRNPWGNVAFDDQFRIFHTDNDNEGSPGFTGCRILHVVDGGDYGWRLRQGAVCCQPDFERATWNGGRPGRLGWVTETGRGAPAGLCVLNSAAFPARSRNTLIYPDVFRRSVRAYELDPRGGTYTVHREFELMTAEDPLFRPDDAEMGPDGALYVLDWRTDSGGAGRLSGDGVHGRIYRLTWGGTPEEPARGTLDPARITGIARAPERELVKALESEDFGLRNAAAHELIRRDADGMMGELRSIASDSQRVPTARLHAIAVLAATGNMTGVHTWGQYFSDLDPHIRRVAYELASHETMPIAFPAEERDIAVLRAYAIALGTMGRLQLTLALKSDLVNPEDVAARLVALAAEHTGADEFVRDGIARGLDRLGLTGLRALSRSITVGPSLFKTAALHSVESLRRMDAADTVLALAVGNDPLPPGGRANLLFAYGEIRQLNGVIPTLASGDASAQAIARWIQRIDISTEPDAQAQAIRLLRGDDRSMDELAIDLFANKLLKSSDPAVRLAAIDTLAQRSSEAIGKRLVEIAADRNRPIEERSAAVAGLSRKPYDSIKRELPNLSRASDDTRYLRELLRTAAAIDHDFAVECAKRLLNWHDGDLRNPAIRLLGEKPDTAEFVVHEFNAGRVPRGELPTVIDAVRHHSTPSLQAALQDLIKRMVLPAPTGEEANNLRRHVVERGNARRGKELFLDAKKGGCAACHRIEGVGGTVGPDLTRVWQTMSFEKRLESIVEPSKEIKEGYVTYKIATTDGRVVTGLLVTQTPEATTLKDAQGKEIRIPASQIEQKGVDKTSLMPAGVAGNLSFEELADLLAFLGNREVQESLRGK